MTGSMQNLGNSIASAKEGIDLNSDWGGYAYNLCYKRGKTLELTVPLV